MLASQQSASYLETLCLLSQARQPQSDNCFRSIFIQAKDGLFVEDGSIGAGSRDFVNGFVQKFAAWARKHQ